MLRDFTYINDIVEGVIRCIDKILLPDLDWDAEDNPSKKLIDGIKETVAWLKSYNPFPTL